MSTVREAMIVAGGAGTRLQPLTATTPKPLLPFCGAPFLAGVIRRLAAIEIERVLLVVGADTGPFEALRPAAATLGVEIEMVPEPEPLDTAGGVRAALDRVSGTFLVLNGDILTDIDLRIPIAAHQAAGAAATLVLTRVADTSTFGVCIRRGQQIVGFVEKPPPGSLPGQDAVNAGTYVLEPDAMARYPLGRLSFERDVFPGLVADGEHVEGVVGEGVWADLGTPERFLEGHRLALDGQMAWPTLADVPPDADGVRRAEDVEVAADATVHGPCLLLPGGRIGAGATVGPYAVLGPGTRVAAGATVRDCVLGAEVEVGTGASLAAVLTGGGAAVGAHLVLHDVVLGDGAVLPAGDRVPAGARVAGPGG